MAPPTPRRAARPQIAGRREPIAIPYKHGRHPDISDALFPDQPTSRGLLGGTSSGWRSTSAPRVRADGGTRSRDRVDYELPGTDSMQDAAEALLVRRDLERIFGYRGERLAELYPPV